MLRSCTVISIVPAAPSVPSTEPDRPVARQCAKAAGIDVVEDGGADVEPSPAWPGGEGPAPQAATMSEAIASPATPVPARPALVHAPCPRKGRRQRPIRS